MQFYGLKKTVACCILTQESNNISNDIVILSATLKVAAAFATSSYGLSHNSF